MPGGGIADVDMREQVQMRANGGLMGLYNRGMIVMSQRKRFAGGGKDASTSSFDTVAKRGTA